MPTCWTCGAETPGFSFSCAACQGLQELSALRREAARADGKLNRIAEIQQRGFDELKTGSSRMANAIEWGFTELAWRLDQQADVLKSLDKILKTPRQKQAEKHRITGDDLLARGVLDDAEKCYRKSVELSSLDYRGYVGLAETLLRLNRGVEAIRVLKRSLRHAPKDESGNSPVENWRSYSLRLIGHVYACHDNYRKAAKRLGEAIALSPNYADALYDHSQYVARLGDAEACVKSLRRAITLKPFYWALVQRQSSFQSVCNEVKGLLGEMRGEARYKCSGVLKRCEDLLTSLNNTFTQMKNELEDIGNGEPGDYKAISSSQEYNEAIRMCSGFGEKVAGHEEERLALCESFSSCRGYGELVLLVQKANDLLEKISETELGPHRDQVGKANQQFRRGLANAEKAKAVRVRAERIKVIGLIISFLVLLAVALVVPFSMFLSSR